MTRRNPTPLGVLGALFFLEEGVLGPGLVKVGLCRCLVLRLASTCRAHRSDIKDRRQGVAALIWQFFLQPPGCMFNVQGRAILIFVLRRPPWANSFEDIITHLKTKYYG